MPYTPKRTDTLPWHRQFWPWVLIALPATTVVACFATILIAIGSSDDLVSDNHYREGLSINRDLAQQNRAAELGLKAEIRIDQETSLVELRLEGQSATAELIGAFAHATRSSRDWSSTLSRRGDGSYQGSFGAVVPGVYHVRLYPTDAEWVLIGRIDLTRENRVSLSPR
jgi:hypothetical protein